VNEEPKITIKLSRFVELLLQSDNHADIPKNEALLIEVLLKKWPNVYHIQWPEDNDTELTFAKPQLWHYKIWLSSSEHWSKLKQDAEEQRRQWHILKRNEIILTQYLQTEWNIETEDKAEEISKLLLARKKIANISTLISLGESEFKLITNFNEL
jgi:hypothetical protein